MRRAASAGNPSAPETENLLIHADARDIATYVPEGSVTLAYLDPPFAVGTSFSGRVGVGSRAQGPVAYVDKWPSLDAYLVWLEERMRAVRRVLSNRGTLWLHLDHRAVHEAKVLCDGVFGAGAFLGEVIWVPGNGSKSRRGPGMTHQTILIYAAGSDYVWNAHDPALRAPFAKTSLAMHFKKRDDDGRLYRERVIAGKTYRYYADLGRALGSVWTDCPSMVANTPLRRETTGYPTQKPLKLLERIVLASSAPGDCVLDPFCGSGTTLEAAARHGRRFVGCDIGDWAIRTTRARLTEASLAYREPRPKRRAAGSRD